MGNFKKFEETDLWKKSMDLVIQVYQVTGTGPFSKDYSLANQIRRSAISIASNIAEGFERDGNKELIQFLYISKGSCGELICQLHIAFRLGYLSTQLFKDLYNLANEISKSIGGLINYLKESDLKGKKFK